MLEQWAVPLLTRLLGDFIVADSFDSSGTELRFWDGKSHGLLPVSEVTAEKDTSFCETWKYDPTYWRLQDFQLPCRGV